MGRLERLTEPEAALSKRQNIQAKAPQRERERDCGTSSTGGRAEHKLSNGGWNETEQAWPTATVVANCDGGAELPVLDKQLLSGEAANTHTHTQAGAQTIQREKRRRTSCPLDVDAQITGTAYLQYWLWRCRDNQMDGSLHPLRKFDPAAHKYDAPLIQTQE